MGLGLGLVWSFWPRVYIVVLLMAAFAAVALPMMRLLDIPMYEMAKTRIKYLRGAQAEGLVGWMLKELEDEWHVFNGMMLVEDWDIDHVVVGPGGLFCVSTKGWRGLLAPGPDGRLMR